MTDHAEQSGDIERVRGRATVELTRLGIRTVAENGAGGLSFAFHDGAKQRYPNAIREATEGAEITLAPP